MAIDKEGEVTTKLLTLLNVSATKVGKRKWTSEVSRPSEKLNKRRATSFIEPTSEADVAKDAPENIEDENGDVDMNENDAAEEDDPVEADTEGESHYDPLPTCFQFAVEDTLDPYERHFGPDSKDISSEKRELVDRKEWKTTKARHGKLGNVTEYTVGEVVKSTEEGSSQAVIMDKLRKPFQERQGKLPKELAALQNDLLSLLASQRDLYLTRTSFESVQNTREGVMLHALNHITKKRRRILKNNERLAHASKSGADPPEDVLDQGFTRPSVLVLVPFRSFALRWLSALTSHTPSPTYQVENHSRFQSEYGLPPGAVDKLATSQPGAYPKDHVEMFKGNVDDSFRVGIKMTRKSVKLFAEFYGCDLILASPLGLRMSIQKEKSSDFLSSIEILVIDQMDALTMQNWEHVQFVMSHLNQLPKESHDVDFSRIKPWYLDGYSAYLRQSILLTAYETPEIRALFNSSLKNVAGKVRTERRWSPISVPDGIEQASYNTRYIVPIPELIIKVPYQNFIQFDCSNPKDEADKRFNHFTTQLLPAVLKSAVQSVNTVVFVPSSFDFIRVHNYFRKNIGVSFTVLSEYSSNQDISRARQAFFGGKKAFLLISERFHFFRRYKIRGIRNLIFYGPPDHPQFYTEFLSYPFLDEGIEPSDVTCRVLYSKYDWMRLERIAGTAEATKLTHRGSL